MKSLILILILSSATFTFAAETEHVAPQNTEIKTEKKTEKKTAEGTEHSFEDLLVQGKYHFSDSAVTTVEEDKVLDSLLGVRSEFKDRIQQSSGRW